MKSEDGELVVVEVAYELDVGPQQRRAKWFGSAPPCHGYDHRVVGERNPEEISVYMLVCPVSGG